MYHLGERTCRLVWETLGNHEKLDQIQESNSKYKYPKHKQGITQTSRY